MYCLVETRFPDWKKWARSTSLVKTVSRTPNIHELSFICIIASDKTCCCILYLFFCLWGSFIIWGSLRDFITNTSILKNIYFDWRGITVLELRLLNQVLIGEKISTRFMTEYDLNEYFRPNTWSLKIQNLLHSGLGKFFTLKIIPNFM